jgi:hypothetical protein
MKRQTLSRATAAALVGVAVLMGGGKSYASDADDVKATINGFHAALTALDLAKMDAIWAHDDRHGQGALGQGGHARWEGTRKSRSLVVRGHIFRFKAIRRGRWAWRPPRES